jgi:hypothetical protein
VQQAARAWSPAAAHAALLGLTCPRVHMLMCACAPTRAQGAGSADADVELGGGDDVADRLTAELEVLQLHADAGARGAHTVPVFAVG